jgi:hypothetical protein
MQLALDNLPLLLGGGALVVGVLLVSCASGTGRHVLKLLDRPIAIERFFYRHHQMVGTVIALGGFFVLCRIAQDFWSGEPLNALTSMDGVFMVLFAVVIFLGLLVRNRPSLLKPVEQFANRWVEPWFSRRDVKENHTDFAGSQVVIGIALAVIGLVVMFWV